MQRAFLLAAAVAVACPIGCLAEQIDVGSGSFQFIDEQGNANRPITVWYHRPKRFRHTDSIVFVMHGVDRIGRDYRDTWIKHAEAHQFLLLVPEFSKEHYPASRMYNEGYMFASNGKPRNPNKWTFTAIERIFDRVMSDNNLKQVRYTIYGHSAGAQFVHRLITFMPNARVKLAIVANAGWYTMPQFATAFPHGLGGTQVGEAELRQAFSTRLIVLLGKDDTDPNHKHLTRTPEALKQGPHRLARGKNYFAVARQQAKQMNADFRWRLQTARGVGHSNSKMSAFAAKLIR